MEKTLCMIFTGHYVAPEQKGCILIELYANNGLQFQQQRQKKQQRIQRKKPTLTYSGGLDVDRIGIMAKNDAQEICLPLL